MILKLVRTPGIYLVGFMGSGKTTVGRLLADELGWNFCDIDESIVAGRNESIADIFDSRGEEEFRRIESQAIRGWVARIERGQPHVVALGGGAFAVEENIQLLIGNGVTVWLDCKLETARLRTAADGLRPLARDPERFAALYLARRANYGRADFRIESDSDPATVVATILQLPIF